MDFTEKTIASKEIFDGKIIKVKLDTVELTNGDTAFRELVEHPGGVGVIGVDENRRVITVKQYRKPFDAVLEEIPAGKLEYGEDPQAAALREFEEETGFTADKMQSIGVFYSSPGYCNEKIHLFLATELRSIGQRLDEGEFLDTVSKTLDELFDEVMTGKIKDGKTVIAVMTAKQILG